MMALEIGERRRAEADLRTAEHRYRLLAEQSPAVTYIWEANRTDDSPPQYYTSPRIEQLLGYTVDEWHASADFWMSRLHPDDRHAVIAAYLRSESTGEPFATEYRYLHKDGSIVWVADQAILMSREDGRPKLFQGVMIDVSSRKDAERAATETELRYRDLAEQLPGVIYMADLSPLDGGYRLRYVSPQLTSLLGYSRPTGGHRALARDRASLRIAHAGGASTRASPKRPGSRWSTGSSTATAASDGSATRLTRSRGTRSDGPPRSRGW